MKMDDFKSAKSAFYHPDDAGFLYMYAQDGSTLYRRLKSISSAAWTRVTQSEMGGLQTFSPDGWVEYGVMY